MVISSRLESGECSAMIGTYVILNESGWILTAGHLIDVIHKQQQSALLHSGYRDNVIQFEHDKTAYKKYRKKDVRTIRKPSKSSIRNHSVWWGIDGTRLVEAKVLPNADLALARLEPFDPTMVKCYPKIKNPDDRYLPGTSLCKLGFPLHQITPTYNENNDTFTLPAGAVPIPALPLEGMFTRTVRTSLPNKGDANKSTFIETSTPSLLGMIGGPVFDTDANVWGIQSHTSHHDLNFNTVVKQGSSETMTHQFLNTGVAVHAKVIREFLDREEIAYDCS